MECSSPRLSTEGRVSGQPLRHQASDDPLSLDAPASATAWPTATETQAREWLEALAARGVPARPG